MGVTLLKWMKLPSLSPSLDLLPSPSPRRPVEEQVPCSTQTGCLGVCPRLSVLPLPFLFTKTKTSPEEFKPAVFVLLPNTDCKPVFLALLMERERQYIDRELKMRGHIRLMFALVEVGKGGWKG